MKFHSRGKKAATGRLAQPALRDVVQRYKHLLQRFIPGVRHDARQKATVTHATLHALDREESCVHRNMLPRQRQLTSHPTL